MKTRCVVGIIAVGLIACLSSAASAAVLTFTIGGGSEFSGTGQSFGGSFQMIFTDTGANQVTLTIDATNMTGPSTAFISDLYFNSSGIDPTTVTASATLTVVSGSVNTAYTYGAGTNAFQADGDGQFDFNADLPPPPGGPANVLNPGEIVSLTLTGAGLDATDFNAISVNGPVGKNGFHVAAHVQGLGTDAEGSGWFAGTPTAAQTPVPEPTSLAIWALGVVAAGFGARRLRKRK